MSVTHNVFMFSGQGSQYFQMGQTLFDANPNFRSHLFELDAIATPLLGNSVVDYLYYRGYKKTDVFNDTRITSPSIFMIEYALAKTLMDDGVKPHYVLGSSLGMCAAACIAGCVTPDNVIRSVIQNAAIFDSRCPNGAMVAILASPDLYDNEPALYENADMAGIYFDSSFVIAARSENLPYIFRFLKEHGHTYQQLAVSRAFHSRWIDAARTPIFKYLDNILYRHSNIPIVCCAQKTVIEEINADAIWMTMRAPIHFAQTIENMEGRGSYCYIDVGPSGSLATSLKYGLPSDSGSTVHSILSPFGRDVENYRRVASSLASA